MGPHARPIRVLLLDRGSARDSRRGRARQSSRSDFGHGDQRLGVAGESAADGAEAVNMISGHNPSVVVTDLSMPGMDGLGLCRRIRESSDVPILVFTSTLEQEGKRDCIAAGASDHAVKGITMQDFLGRVRGLVARRA